MIAFTLSAVEWNATVANLLEDQDAATLRREQGIAARAAPTEYEEGKEVIRMAMGQLDAPTRNPVAVTESTSTNAASPSKPSINKRNVLAAHQDQLELLREERNVREARFQQMVRCSLRQ